MLLERISIRGERERKREKESECEYFGCVDWVYEEISCILSELMDRWLDLFYWLNGWCKWFFFWVSGGE